MDHATVMLGRVRRHLMTALGGVVVALFSIVTVLGVGHAAFGEGMPVWVVALALLSIAIIPIAGFYSTYRNLRCPACEKSVVFLASTHVSLFGGVAPRQCPHCRATIFDERLHRRGRRLIIVGSVVAITVGAVMAVLNASR